VNLAEKVRHFERCAEAHEAEGRHQLAKSYRCDAEIARLTIRIREVIADKALHLKAHHAAEFSEVVGS